jgi:hypothetical protein
MDSVAHLREALARMPWAGLWGRGGGQFKSPARKLVYQEHVEPIPALSERLGVFIDPECPEQSPGLSDLEAAARLNVQGPNELTPPDTKPEWLRWAHLILLTHAWLPLPRMHTNIHTHNT